MSEDSRGSGHRDAASPDSLAWTLARRWIGGPTRGIRYRARFAFWYWQEKRQWPERLQRARQEHRQWVDEQVRAPGSNVWPASDFLVSVMVPSRGRPDRLRSDLGQCSRYTASDPERVEILVWLDDDDTPSLDVKDEPACRLRAMQLEGARGVERQGLRRYAAVFSTKWRRGRRVTTSWCSATMGALSPATGCKR